MSRLNKELSKLNMKKKTQFHQKMDQDMKKIYHQRRNTDNKYSKN